MEHEKRRWKGIIAGTESGPFLEAGRDKNTESRSLHSTIGQDCNVLTRFSVRPSGPK